MVRYIIIEFFEKHFCHFCSNSHFRTPLYLQVREYLRIDWRSSQKIHVSGVTSSALLSTRWFVLIFTFHCPTSITKFDRLFP